MAVGALAFLLGVISGNSLVASLIRGILAASSVFAAWAIAREIDPDHEYSAFVGAGMAILLVWAIDDAPQLIALLWLVLAIRAINRSTGLAPTLFDSIAILALGTWLSFTQDWAYLAATALTFILISIPPLHNRRPLGFGAIAAVLAIASLSSQNAALELESALPAIGISALFVPVLVSSKTPISTADYTGVPLEGSRVRMGQAFALSAGTLLAASGDVSDLMPLWAATLGASLYWATEIIRHELPKLASFE